MAMRRHVIERDLPAIGTADREALEQAAIASKAALAQLAPRIQWELSISARTKSGTPYHEDAAPVFQFDDDGLVERHALDRARPRTVAPGTNAMWAGVTGGGRSVARPEVRFGRR